MRASFLVAASISLAATALAARVPKDVWTPLSKPGGKWTLRAQLSRQARDHGGERAEGGRHPHRAPEVELPAVRRRLYPRAPGAARAHRQRRLLLADEAKDAEIDKALAGRPTFALAPKPAKAYSHKDGLFAFVAAGRADTLCVGLGAKKPAPGEPSCGSSPCYQWPCLDPSGIVGAGGIADGEDYGFEPKIPGDAPPVSADWSGANSGSGGRHAAPTAGPARRQKRP